MKIEQINTENDYQEALKEVEILMAAKLNTPEGERLYKLITLIEAYEQKQFHIDI
ncbi:hypothetical protein [Nitrosomonas sp.]|uniref:hypothetical protein n=1 Tax=Nitrosomonas sp. TaxID=42353 RepID=UPI0025ECB7A8|nr:hypothetical protein [Nitrosomonas sp.]MBY0485380.1 hypothetical protein [Nitrosomonas sp.]